MDGEADAAAEPEIPGLGHEPVQLGVAGSVRVQVLPVQRQDVVGAPGHGRVHAHVLLAVVVLAPFPGIAADDDDRGFDEGGGYAGGVDELLEAAFTGEIGAYPVDGFHIAGQADGLDDFVTAGRCHGHPPSRSDG
jgi:hypothetical protein